jgi:hypothetical protein
MASLLRMWVERTRALVLASTVPGASEVQAWARRAHPALTILYAETMQLPNGRRLTVPQAADVLSAYDREASGTWDLYDNLDPGPRNEFRATDVLALNALNAFGPALPMKGMTAFWSREAARREAETLLAEVDDRDLEDLTRADVIAATTKLAAVADTIAAACRRTGFSHVAIAKLLHRMRPGLAAIYDTRVDAHYPQESWETFYRAVALDVWRNRRQLEAARAQSSRPSRTLIRAWDILMWWRST